MSRVRDLNNRVARHIADGELAEAESVLDQIEKLLQPGVGLDATFDEYFYRCHRVHVGWSRGTAPLQHARRAAELEDAIDAAACKLGRREQLAYSQGAWSLVSVLTRAGLLDDAEAALSTLIADEQRFAARMSCNAAAAEQALVAGLCIFFERDLQRARPLVERIARLVPDPRNAELLYGLACFHARMNERDAALERLEQAIARGFARAHAAKDSDLKSLHGEPRFERALSPPRGPAPPEWSIDSHPAGARLFIDDQDTGLRTPARLPARPRGLYRIRLSLDGHGDALSEHHQSSDAAGLSMSMRLPSLASLAERARMAEDSERVPDERAQSATRDFLGPDWSGASILVVRSASYGLAESRISVDGRGRVSLPGGRAPRLDPAATRRLFEAFVDEAFTEIVIAPHTGVPDELYFTVTLANGRGGTHSLGKFVQTPHRRFERLVAAVGALLSD